MLQQVRRIASCSHNLHSICRSTIKNALVAKLAGFVHVSLGRSVGSRERRTDLSKMSKPRISARYSEQICKDMMSRVDGSQTGIQSATAQIVFWKRNAQDVVRSWQQVFFEADMEKRMNLIYLANDVVQTGRKTGREFSEAFHQVLPDAIRHMLRHSDEQAQKKLKKLVNVWKDRQVWGNKALSVYLGMFRGVAAEEVPVNRGTNELPSVVLPDPFKNLAQALLEAHESMLEVHRLSKVDATSQEELQEAIRAEGVVREMHRHLVESALKSTQDLTSAVQQHINKQRVAQIEVEKLRDAKAADVARHVARLTEIREVQAQHFGTLRAFSGASIQGNPSNMLRANLPTSAPDLMGSSSDVAGNAGRAHTPDTALGRLASNVPSSVNTPSTRQGQRDPRLAHGGPQVEDVSSFPSPPRGSHSALGQVKGDDQIDLLGQLTGMDPERSAALLAQAMHDAPPELQQQFGDAIQQLSTA